MMNFDSNPNLFLFIGWIISIVTSVFAGILAWNWIEPEGFFGFIFFLITWGLLSTVGFVLSFGALHLIVKFFNN